MTKKCQKGQFAEWPTRNLKEVLKKFTRGVDSVGTELDPDRVEDITESQEARLQLLTFMPKIKIIGLELLFERHRMDKEGTWGGVFVRALKEKSTENRCLQYIFVYTRQLTIVSPVWWVIFPLLLAWVPGSLSAFFPLFIASILLHMFDSPVRFRVRIITGLILFWFIWALEAFVSPLPFYLLNILAILFFCYFVYTIVIETPYSHMMDYIPVFVWIEKTEDDWVLKSAAWDIWHYRACKESLEQLTTSPWARLQKDGFVENKKRVRLAMDNPWHSLYRRPMKIWFMLVMFVGGIIATLILFSDIYLLPASWYAIHPRNTPTDIIFLIIVIYISIVLRYEWSFIKDEKEVVEKAEKLLEPHNELEEAAKEKEISDLWEIVEFMPLCDENLEFLWNMVPKEDVDTEGGRFRKVVTRVSDRVHRRPDEVKKARLIVISKLQDPFTDDWETFLDK